MLMEMQDILDCTGKKTGKTICRADRQSLKKGEYVLAIHVWIYDDNGNYLVQRRSLDRPTRPGRWYITAGAVIAGEDSMNAAKRECMEELGLEIEEQNMLKVNTVLGNKSIIDIWAVRANVSIDKLELQKEEVMDVKWVDKDQMKQILMDERDEKYNLIFDKYDKYR